MILMIAMPCHASARVANVPLLLPFQATGLPYYDTKLSVEKRLSAAWFLRGL